MSNIECRIMNYEGFLLFCLAVSMLFTNIEINWLSSSIKGSKSINRSSRSKVLPSFDIHHSLFDIRYSKYIPNTISQLKLALMGVELAA